MADARAQFRNDFGASSNAAPTDPIQAAPDSLEMDQIVASHEGTGWVSGCFVNAPGGMKVEVDDGVIMIQNARLPVRGKVLDIAPNPTGTPRRDSVRADGSGPYVVTGTAAPQPVSARMRLDEDGVANETVLGSVYVPANTTQGILKTYVTQAGIPPSNTQALRGRAIQCEPIVSDDGLASMASGMPYYQDNVWYDDTPGYEAYYVIWVNNLNQAVLACRGIHEKHWDHQQIASVTGTGLGTMTAADFLHVYAVSGMDADGRLHIVGNIHTAPHKGMKTKWSMRVKSTDLSPPRLRDIHHWENEDAPTGMNEASSAFPMFAPLPSGDLIYMCPQAAGGPSNSRVSLKRHSSGSWQELGGRLGGDDNPSNATAKNDRIGFISRLPTATDLGSHADEIGGRLGCSEINLSSPPNWDSPTGWSLMENPIAGGVTLSNGHICALNPATGLTDATYIGTGHDASQEYMLEWFTYIRDHPGQEGPFGGLWVVKFSPGGVSATQTQAQALARGANGDFNSHYETLADNFKLAVDAAGFGTGPHPYSACPIYLTPFREFNVDHITGNVNTRGWNPSAFTGHPADPNAPANGRKWFRQVVQTMRARQPALNFKFGWVPATGNNVDMTVGNCYPGDDVTDFVGLDTYDYINGGTSNTWTVEKAYLENDGVRWTPAHMHAVATTPTMRNVTIDGTPHNGSGTKPFAFPEWGLGFTTNVDSDRPQFVQWMSDFIKANVNEVFLASCFTQRIDETNPKALVTFQSEWGTVHSLSTVALIDGLEAGVTTSTAFIGSAQIDSAGDLHLIWNWRPGGVQRSQGWYYAKITGLQDTTGDGQNLRAWRDPRANHDDPHDFGAAPHREIRLPICRNPADMPGTGSGPSATYGPEHFPIRVVNFGGEYDGEDTGIGGDDQALSRLINNASPFFSPTDLAGNPHVGFVSIVGQPSHTLGMGGTIHQFHVWYDPDMPESTDARVLADGWHVQQLSDYVTAGGTWNIGGTPAGSVSRFSPVNTQDGRTYMIGTWPNEGYGGSAWAYDVTGLTDTDGIPKPFRIHNFEAQGDWSYCFNGMKHGKLMMLMTRKDRIFKDPGDPAGDQPGSDDLSPTLAPPSNVLAFLQYDTNQMDVIGAGMVKLPGIKKVESANAMNVIDVSSSAWVGVNQVLDSHLESALRAIHAAANETQLDAAVAQIHFGSCGVINIGAQYAGKVLFTRLTMMGTVESGWLACAVDAQNMQQVNAQVMQPGIASNVVEVVPTPSSQPPQLHAGTKADDSVLSPQTVDNPLNNYADAKVAAVFIEGDGPPENTHQSQWVAIPNFRDLNGGAGRLVLITRVGGAPTTATIMAATWELGVLDY